MPPSKASLAKIHIAKKELGLTDEAYRDILAFNFGVVSSKSLSEMRAKELIRMLKAKGWQQKAPTSRAKASRQYIEIKPGPAARQQRKVLALWSELGYGVEKLHARVKRQFGVDRIEWLDEHDALHILITDLKHRLKKQGGN